MFEYTVEFDEDIFQDLIQAFRDAPSRMGGEFGGRAGPIRQRVLAALKADPGPVSYPFVWKTDKQRNYYFAVVAEYDDDGNIIPYQRTGKSRAGWQWFYNVSDEEIDLTLFNPVSYTKFVFGPAQQPGHKKTGWPNVVPVVLQAEEDLIEAAIDSWFVVNERALEG